MKKDAKKEKWLVKGGEAYNVFSHLYLQNRPPRGIYKQGFEGGGGKDDICASPQLAPPLPQKKISRYARTPVITNVGKH